MKYDSFISNKKFLSAVLFFCLAAFMTGAAKSEFYDPNFETSKPPVYLKGILGTEPELSKIAVKGIVPGSPAAQSGLRRGDEILSFAGENLNRSGRTLYRALFHLYEGQPQTVPVGVKRGAETQEVLLAPDYNPAHVVLGIQYGFIRPDGRRLGNVQFVKREVSQEGIEHDAIYDFRDTIRVSTKCHWWGRRILVVEWDLFNDRNTPLQVRLNQITVKDQKGNLLEPIDSETAANMIYNKEAIDAVMEAPFSWKKKEAEQAYNEMAQLREELAHHNIRDTDVPSKSRFYGTLYYAMTPVQPPVFISAKFGKEKFSSKFEFNKEIAVHSYAAPENSVSGQPDSQETSPGGSSEDSDVLL